MKTLGIHDKEMIAAMLARIVSECDKVNTERLYDEMLDECYSFEKVGGPFKHISPSRVLAECDPTAYRCGHNDWLNGERDSLVEIESDYYQTHEVDRAKDEFLDEQRDKLNEKLDELAELEQDSDVENQLEAMREEITRLESAIDACDCCAF